MPILIPTSRCIRHLSHTIHSRSVQNESWVITWVTYSSYVSSIPHSCSFVCTEGVASELTTVPLKEVFNR